MIKFLEFAFANQIAGLVSLLILASLLVFAYFVWRELLIALVAWREAGQQPVSSRSTARCWMVLTPTVKRKNVCAMNVKLNEMNREMETVMATNRSLINTAKNIGTGLLVVLVIAASAGFVVAALAMCGNTFKVLQW